MSTNKNAVIRYLAIDRCLSNVHKTYTIENLIDACNEALEENDPETSGVQRRQIFYDIQFMESPEGYDAPIDRIRDGRKTYYRYSDRDFSIRKQPINATETQQLADAIAMLGRFKGLPNFEWMEEVIGKLESTFEINRSSAAVVGFDQNIDLNGLKFFSDLFNAIVSKKLLRIRYTPFEKLTQEMIVSPYYLKQYNNRWFLFCRREGFDNITNLALDRMNFVEPTKGTFRENTDIDFSVFFKDIVGVTHPNNGKKETVILQVAENFVGYFETKPIHKPWKKSPDNIFTLRLIPNYEFETYLFSHSDKIKVLAPESLREAILNRIEDAKAFQCCGD